MGAEEVANESPTSFRGPRQIHIVKRQLLAKLTGAAAAGGVAKFYVQNPDSRCRLRVSIVSDSLDDLSAAGLSLWLAGAEWDQRGPSGLFIPHTDLEGEQATPAPIPINGSSGLRGYSREFVTSADLIYGELTLAASEAESAVAKLYVTARIQPDGQRLPWEDWAEVRSELRTQIMATVVR